MVRGKTSIAAKGGGRSTTRLVRTGHTPYPPSLDALDRRGKIWVDVRIKMRDGSIREYPALMPKFLDWRRK